MLAHVHAQLQKTTKVITCDVKKVFIRASGASQPITSLDRMIARAHSTFPASGRLPAGGLVACRSKLGLALASPPRSFFVFVGDLQVANTRPGSSTWS